VPPDQRPPVLDNFDFTPKSLIYALLPPDQIDGDSIRVPITISVTARSQGAQVSEVQYVVLPASTLEEPLESGVMAPQENSRYEQTFTLTLSALELSTYTIFVYAIDENGQTSGEVRGSLRYFRSFDPGSPPMIDSLAVPDTLQRPAPGEPAIGVLLVAAVSDANGPSDIATVEFWNINSPAVRFPMCDNGGLTPCGVSSDSGDLAANDSLFTRRVSITSGNAAGTTTLVFQATDRAGLQSAEHTRDIVIQ